MGTYVQISIFCEDVSGASYLMALNKQKGPNMWYYPLTVDSEKRVHVIMDLLHC
jgi:hypothetical protein